MTRQDSSSLREDEDGRRQPERSQHEAGAGHPSGGDRRGSILTTAGLGSTRRRRFPVPLRGRGCGHLLLGIVDHHCTSALASWPSRPIRSGPDRVARRSPAGPGIAPAIKPSRASRSRSGHAAEAIVGDELAWRGRCVAQAARQVRGLPPRRPTGTELLEHRVSHTGQSVPSSEGWLRCYGSNSDEDDTVEFRTDRQAREQAGGWSAGGLAKYDACSRLRRMDDQIRPRPHLAMAANVRGATCGSSGVARWDRRSSGGCSLHRFRTLVTSPSRRGAAASCGRTPNGRTRKGEPLGKVGHNIYDDV